MVSISWQKILYCNNCLCFNYDQQLRKNKQFLCLTWPDISCYPKYRQNCPSWSQRLLVSVKRRRLIPRVIYSNPFVQNIRWSYQHVLPTEANPQNWMYPRCKHWHIIDYIIRICQTFWTQTMRKANFRTDEAFLTYPTKWASVAQGLF